MQPIWLHIGLPKTATTLLQHKFFPNHPQLDFWGKFSKGNWRKDFDANFKFPILGEILVNISCINGTQYNFDDTISLIKKLKPLKDKKQVLSLEGLSSRDGVPFYTKMIRLKKLFPNSKIIFVIRKPKDLLQSFFFKDEGTRLKGRDPSILNKEFECWLQSNYIYSFEGKKNDRISLLDFYFKALFLKELFGKHNLCILVYEKLIQNKNGFINDLCEFLEIDLTIGNNIPTNYTINNRKIDYNLEYTESWSKYIKSITEYQICALNAIFKLNLDKYGYFNH